jgi:hypothetical protein
MESLPRKKQPKSKPLFGDDLIKATNKLEQQISELENYDVKAITGRLDANIKALENKVNKTLSDIFGHNTSEYHKYLILTLDTLPIVFGGPKDPLPEVQQGYQKGINECVAKLRYLKETLQQK